MLATTGMFVEWLYERMDEGMNLVSGGRNTCTVSPQNSGIQAWWQPAVLPSSMLYVEMPLCLIRSGKIVTNPPSKFVQRTASILLQSSTKSRATSSSELLLPPKLCIDNLMVLSQHCIYSALEFNFPRFSQKAVHRQHWERFEKTNRQKQTNKQNTPLKI